MAMSISGAALSSSLGSSFLISGGKKSGIGCGVSMRVSRKNVFISSSQRWIPKAVKDDGNSKLDPTWLDDASQKASEYVKEKGSEVGNISAQKGQEVKDHIDRAKDFIVEKASEAIDNAAEIAQFGSEFVTEKGKETKKETASMADKAKEFIVEKACEVIDIAMDVSKKIAKCVRDKATEVKEAILPPKT